MTDETQGQPETLALSTTLEENFVSPLTAVRGVLEILRDFPDLEADKRTHFVERALNECARLESGVRQLARTVYAGARPEEEPKTEPGLSDRLIIDEAIDLMELDFSNLEFSSSDLVNEFFDLVDRAVIASQRRWYFLVNYSNCHVWPEAWITFAHRGKKVNVNYALGTVRYAEGDAAAQSTVGQHAEPSREAALARIEEMRREGS